MPAWNERELVRVDRRDRAVAGLPGHSKNGRARCPDRKTRLCMLTALYEATGDALARRSRSSTLLALDHARAAPPRSAGRTGRRPSARSRRASASSERAGRYTRAESIESKASATWMIRAPSGMSVPASRSGIAAAVVALVVVADRRDGVVQEAEALDDRGAVGRVAHDQRPLRRVEPRRLEQDRVRQRPACRCRGRAPRTRAARAPPARGRARRRSRARSAARAASGRRCRRRARRPSP